MGAGRDPASPPGRRRRRLAARPTRRPGATTDQRIADPPGDRARAAARAPTATPARRRLPQKVRETGDAAFYVQRRRGSSRRALRSRPRDPGALTERGALELSRHDFRGAPARRAAPPAAPRPTSTSRTASSSTRSSSSAATAPAGRALQRMVDRQPDLAAYARVSYFRELHGDLRGARRRDARSPSPPAARRRRTSPTCRRCSATSSSRAAALGARGARLPRGARALPALRAGRGRAGARRGRARRPARRDPARCARSSRALPLPEYVVALGETELAAGRHGAAARRDLALVGAEQRLLARGRREHRRRARALRGRPRRAARAPWRSARRAWAQAPSVRSADALGWALTRAGRPREGLRWARRALRLGSRDPSFLYHAGMAARAAGRPRRSRARWLHARAGARTRASRRCYAPRAARRWRGCDEARSLLAALPSLAALARAAAPAAAHPLGNFSVNHLDVVRGLARPRRRALHPRPGRDPDLPGARPLAAPQVLAAKRAEVARAALTLRVDGRPVALRARGPAAGIAFPPGQGGLQHDARRARLARAASTRARRVELRDGTFPGRVGWQAVVVAAGRAGPRCARACRPSDPTARPAPLPAGAAREPADRRAARLRRRARARHGRARRARPARPPATTRNRARRRLRRRLRRRRRRARGVLVLLLLAAFGWGALHALSPGHGKAMVAAYLVGTRGTARHAVALGADRDGDAHDRRLRARARDARAVAVRPARGPVPVAQPGLGAARSSSSAPRVLRRACARAARHGTISHDHGTTTHSRSPPPRRHEPPHDPAGLLAMGASAGLIPCPSALVVLLGAIAQHQVALGLRADRRLQRRAGRDAHRARARRRQRPGRIARRSARRRIRRSRPPCRRGHRRRRLRVDGARHAEL